jgi:serine/threonine protein kinase/Tol biopolymer transport system component
MNPERQRQIEALYHAVRDPERRSEALAKADPEIRREVEALLAADNPARTETMVGVGLQIGPYRVDAQVGEGGMGVVFRAHDTKLNRPVAIKFLSDELADASARRRFQREAQLASSLNHPHILTVYDAGEFEGRQYLVTEFVDGGTLKNWTKQQPRNWQDVAELLTGVADGLAAAHAAGILHRDIKPDNILITASGYAKLSDFGLAKLEEAVRPEGVTRTLTEGHTRPGMIVGTIAYMSPEQASGKPLDARSDIFSFGVVLYEMLAGRRPFVGATDLELLQRVIHESPAPLREELPAPMRALVARALQKNPEDRYQSMRDMVVDLRRALRQNTEGLPAYSTRPRKWITGAVVAIVILAAVGGVFWFRSRQASGPPRPDYVALTNFSDSAVAPALSPDGHMLAFIRGEGTFEGRGDVYVKILPDGEPARLTHDGGIKMGPLVFSKDGSRIAYSEGTKNSWTVPVLGGSPGRVLTNAGTLSWVDPSARPPRVMYSAHTGEGFHMGVFTATESRSGERKVYLPEDENGMAHRSFLSPDRKSVLIVEMDLSGWLPCRAVPFDGSSLGHRVGPAPAQCTDAAWSPDGKWMYFSANAGSGYHIWRQRFPDGTPEQVTSGATEEQGLSFAADGKSFVTSVGESQSTLWVHDSKGDRQITSEGYAYLPSFSPDAKRMYYLQRSNANRRFVSGELWMTDLETDKKQRLLPDFLMEHYNVSPDGKQVIFITADGTGHAPLSIATLDGSSAPRNLVGQDCVRALFGPDGEIFFVGGTAGNMFLQRIQANGTGLQKIIPEKAAFLYDISPDGKWLATWIGSDVAVVPAGGGSRILLCQRCGTAGEENRGVTPPLMSWSRDGKLLYVHSTETRQTYAVPLKQGQILPPLPASGIDMGDAEGTIAGARAIPQARAFMSADPSVYAYPRVVTHRNIYRIPVP